MIRDEVEDFVNSEVKNWKEKEKEKDKISFKEIFKHKENMEKEVIKVIKTKENII